jgi:hypothetical protein
MLGSAVVDRYARLTEGFRPTGRTRHYLGAIVVDDGELEGGTLIPAAAALAIAHYLTEDGYYLFGLDVRGDVQSDTWHETIEDALAQAEFEYEGLDWAEPSH